MRRRLGRRDANHAAIVRALTAAGCSVLDLSAARIPGCPDLCVGRNRVTYLLEIKSSAAGRDRYAYADQAHQREWHARWRGGPVVVVRSVDEALRVVGLFNEPTPCRLCEEDKWK